MPIIRFECQCGEIQKHFYRAGLTVPSVMSCKCGLDAKRVLMGIKGMDTKVVVDNGVMARKVEVSVEHIKDNENRARFRENQREKK